MAIYIRKILDGDSSVDGLSFVTASDTFIVGRFYIGLLEYSNGVSVNTPAPSSITGGLTTWSMKVQNQYKTTGVNRTANSIWYGLCTSTATSALTINYAATSTGCNWLFYEILGSDTTGVNGVNSLPQTTIAQANVLNGGTITGTFTNPPANENSRILGMVSNNGNPGWTYSGGFTQRGTNQHASPSEALSGVSEETAFETSLIATNATGGTTQTGITLTEIKCAPLNFFF